MSMGIYAARLPDSFAIRDTSSSVHGSFPLVIFHCSVPAFMIAFPSYIDKQGISE